MITTTLQHLHRYKSLSVNLATAIDYILATDFTQLTAGRHDVDGDAVFALVNEFTTKPPGGGLAESHRKYIDIQLMISGVERFGYAPLQQRVPQIPFEPDNDIAFYAPEDLQYVVLHEGQCVFFFPEDIHQPELAADAPVPVKKVVMKIHI